MILTVKNINLLSSEISYQGILSERIAQDSAVRGFALLEGITHNAQLLTFSEKQIIAKSQDNDVSAYHVIKGIEDRFKHRGLEVGCLNKFKHRLVDTLNVGLVKNGATRGADEFVSQTIKTILEDIAINHVVPDPVSKWLEDALPETLKKGLTPEFLKGVLDDKAVQERVQAVLAAEVRNKLDLNI